MKLNVRRMGLIVSIIMAVFLIMPHFTAPVYGGLTTKDAEPGGSYEISQCCYKINKGGTYTFTAETAKNYITVDTSEKVDIYLKDVTIDTESGYEHPAISIDGSSDVTIYAEGTNYLQGGKRDHWLYTNDGYAGIRVATNAQVTVLGNGSLETHGGGGARGAAGIGGNYDNSCGKITIGDDTYSPTVTATGGGSGGGNDGAAGIGGGYDGQANNGIIINDGTVTATGGNGAAGIGGGQAYMAGSGGKVDNIQIHGGTVTATGGEDGAGIGSGEASSSGDGGDASNILITGGDITATGGEGGGAGIGGGDGGNVNHIQIGVSVVDGLPADSYVKATGGTNGAGIGSSNGDVGFLYVYLNGGTVEATGGTDAAGIGGGDGKAEDIYIEGAGTVIATGHDESAAIGAGHNKEGGNITITGYGYNGPESQKDNPQTDKSDYGLVIEASNTFNSSDNDAAVIGGADSRGGDIRISGAYITLSSKTECEGAGIGAGANSSLSSGSMGTIEIEDSYIDDRTSQDRYAPTIGAGRSSLCEEIDIENCYIDGAGIGGSNNQADFFDDPKITSIRISKSTVYAYAKTKAGTNRINARAAIGSGCYGAIGNIYITESKIEAKSEGGAGIGSGGYYSDDSSGELNWKGGACGLITIRNSDVTSYGGDGGAGIGGGWGTPVKDIDIEYSNIKAEGSSIAYTYTDGNTIYQGAAGIGGGWSESCEKIYIDKSTVDASGRESSAGIGSSGSYNKYAKNWDASVKGSIEIGSSTVKARGGSGGAGIGAGEGATFDSGTEIIFRGDCKIDAAGGVGGAGIGGGKAGYDDRGGESCPITVSMSRTAYKENPEDTEAYVKAQGGAGAAGIGSGGANGTGGDPNDAEEITIYGGYVYAKGGDEGDIKAGSGAGIGGGNGGGKLKSFVVKNGVVEAHAGSASNHGAYDIGAGGNDDSRSDYKCKVKVEAGTVLGRISNDGGQTTIDGGSVSDLTEGAKNSNGTQLYKTTMRIFTPYTHMTDYDFLQPAPGELPSGLNVTSCDNFKEYDIFSDKNSRAYLWLPASEEDKATAEYKEKQGNNTVYYNYYGTTKTDNTGWMKMGGKLNFILDEEPYVDQIFRLYLDDSEISGEIEFSLKQDSPEEDCIEIVNQNNTAPGAWVDLLATDFVSYTVTAIAEESNIESELYWDAEGSYSGSVAKEKEYILSVDDPSKVYDGKPVEDPAVELKSMRPETEISYKYYDKSGNYLGDDVRPVDAGTYFVKVRIAGDEQYEPVETDMRIFYISKREISLDISASSPGTVADIRVYAENAVDDPGEVSITIESDGQTVSDTGTFALDDETGLYAADFHYDNAPEGGVYNITADYAGSMNYSEAATEELYSKDKKDRSVTLNSIEYDYGYTYAEMLYATLSELDILNDTYHYEIVCDFYKQLGAEDTIRIRENGATATVYCDNAGKVIAKVTVTNPFYNDAVAYSTVTVNQAPLIVSSFAHPAGDDTVEIKEIPYGSIDGNISYALQYDGFAGVDSPDNFALGKLYPLPLHKTAQVGEHEIKIIKTGIQDPSSKDPLSRFPFYSRNYDVKLVPGVVNVIPEALYVNVSDASGKYGMTEPEYDLSFGDADGNYGLMPWDTQDEVIISVGPEKNFADYKPGVYKNEITVETIEKNYKFTDENGTSTIKCGTLTIEKGTLKPTVSVESYTYNGKAPDMEINAVPVTGDGISPDSLADPGEPEVIFYEKSEGGSWSKLEAAPVNVGSYKVETVYAEDEYYNSASASDEFEISKAACDVEIPEVPDIYIKEGLKLSDQELPEGWKWINGDKKLKVGHVTEPAIYTPEDSGNYDIVEADISFKVMKNPAEVIIKEDISKVYDGKAVTDPAVVKTTDAENVVYTYHDVTNDRSLDEKAPVYAGKYSVTASVTETAMYTAAESDPVEFVIEKRNVVLEITGKDKVDGDIAKAEITVEVLGTDGVDLDEGSELTLYVSEGSGEYSKIATEKIEQVDGRYVVVFSFTRASVNHYDVKAVFAETHNFNSRTAERSFDKNAEERDLEIIAEHPEYMSEDTITVTYGTDPETITAKVSESYYGDEYEFEIVSDSTGKTDEPAITLENADSENQKQIVFKNAGAAVIKVTVSNEAYYADAVEYVTVIVKPAALKVTAEDVTVTYGDTEPAEYGYSIEGLIDGDTADDVVKSVELAGVYSELNAGVYEDIIKVSVKNNPNYNITADPGTLTIEKADPQVETPAVPDIYISEGLKLSDQPLPEGWRWIDGTKELEVGAVSEKAEYIPEDTSNYNIAVRTVGFNVLINPAEISIAEDPTKVYDGKAVTDPVVISTTDAETVTYTYRDLTNGQYLGEAAPVNAGKYSVTASVAETEMYTAAESEPVEFTIEKRDVVLAVTGEDKIDGDIAKADITVEVIGSDGVALDEGSEITLYVRESSGEYSEVSTEKIVKSDGKYYAVFSFTSVTADHYDVKAVFTETQNYNSAEAERSFDKEAEHRYVEIIPEHPECIDEDAMVVTYGTEPETITAQISENYPGDEYEFEIVTDSAGNLADPTITLKDADSDDKKQIVFENAGTAVIKVTVSNKAYYEDAAAYLTVVVKRVEAEITSYAYEKGDVDKTSVTSVEYGQAGELSARLKYSDNMDGNGETVLKVHEAESLPERAGVNEEGWPVRIVKTGDPEAWKPVLRNYNITYKEGIVHVTPVDLKITVENVTVKEGEAEPVEYGYSIEGLVEWDTADDVVESVGLKDAVFEDLEPGVYEDMITVTVKDNPNYTVTSEAGTLTIEKADPSEPDEPEDPSEPSKPDEPTDPSEPDEPTDPSDPDDPTDPSDPDDPTDPSDPDDPTDPSEPDDPLDPSDPDDPTDPSDPDDPTDPSDPDDPTDPSDPDDPTDPSDSDDPTDPSDPDDPTDSSEPDDPIDPSEPGDTDNTSQTGDNFNMMLWMMILITSGAICVALLGLRKRNV